jgi:hypothetical protein
MTRKLDIPQENIDLEKITASEHAKAAQMASRAESRKTGHAGRLQGKGKARTAEKPWGGKRAR